MSAALKLIKTDTGSAFSIKLMNVNQFEQALGADVLAAFARMFVHVDRLNSMFSFMNTSSETYGEHTVAFERDLQTAVWFIVGTLRELALAIQDLRSMLAKKGILSADSAHWLKLREVEDRWNNNASFRKMRDRAAFHIDQDVMVRGVQRLVKEERDVDLLKADDDLLIRGSFVFGLSVLYNGLDWTNPADYEQFIEKVRADHADVLSAIQLVFNDVAMAARIPVL